MSTKNNSDDQNLLLEEIIEIIRASELQLLWQHQLNRIEAIAGLKVQSIEPLKCRNENLPDSTFTLRSEVDWF